MKQLKKLKVFGLMAMLISMVIMASSCSYGAQNETYIEGWEEKI